MPSCVLCGEDRADLTRVAGLGACERCRAADPAEGLRRQGIAVAWDVRPLRFQAGLGIPDQDPAFQLTCVPEQWYHQAWQLLQKEVEIGDPDFDRRVRVVSNDPAQARARLAPEGVQSALLRLLGGVRANDLLGNRVRLRGPTLEVGLSPLGGVPEDIALELKQYTAALALHFRRRPEG